MHRECVFVVSRRAGRDGKFHHRCRVCRRVLTTRRNDLPIHARCSGRPRPIGPGTQLHRLIALLGIKPIVGCLCRRRKVYMDQWGSRGCLWHIRTIAGWMREEAARRGYRPLRLVAIASYGLVLTAIGLAVVRNCGRKILELRS